MANSVEKASISRLSDINGQARYRTDIGIVFDNGVSQELHVVHIPSDLSANDSSYDGVLWISEKGGDKDPMQQQQISLLLNNQQPGQVINNPQPQDRYISIEYSKKKDTNGKNRMIARLLRANLNSLYEDDAFKNGVLDLNVGTNTQGDYEDFLQNSNAAVNAITMVAFNLDLENGSGTTSYWQNPGSNYSENARGMIFELKANEEGLLTGCGNSGAASDGPTNALSIRKSIKESRELTPLGFYHPALSVRQNDSECSYSESSDATGEFHRKDCSTRNQAAQWYKPKIANQVLAEKWVKDQTGDIVSRQCVKQNKAGIYAIDKNIITEDAGFELLESKNSSFINKKISAPDLSALKAIPID